MPDRAGSDHLAAAPSAGGARTSADPLVLAEIVRAEIRADIASVALSYEEEGAPLSWAHALSDSAASLAPLIDTAVGDPIGLTSAAITRMRPVQWERLGDEPLFAQSIAQLYASAPRAAARGRAIGDAVGAALPIGPALRPSGAIAVVDLEPVRSVAVLTERLSLVAPRIAMRAHEGALVAQVRFERAAADTLADTSGTAALVWDPQGRLLRASGAVDGLFGVSLGPDARGSSRAAVVGMLRSAFADPLAASGRFLASGGSPERDIWRARTVEGRLLEVTTAPLHDDHRPLRGTIDVVVDVTHEDRPAAPAEPQRAIGPGEQAGEDEVAISRAAHALASRMTRAQVYEGLIAEAMDLVPSEKAAVLALNTRGVLLPVATSGLSESTVERMHFHPGEGLAGSVVQSRRALICEDTDADERITDRIGRMVRAEGVRSFIHVPISLGERVHGIVTLHSTSARRYGPRELRMLTELGLHAAAALQNAAQYEHERYVAETLQEALLAQELPRVPGLELAALYRPSEGAAVGGDLYNVWVLPDGQVAVLVGDVSGKGVDAAGTTAVVRYMAEAFSQREQDPGLLMGDLNRALCERVDEGTIVTAVLLVIDPDSFRLRWAIAGHPPPFLVDAKRQVSALDDPDPPCGAFADSAYRTRAARFDPGSLLFAYTDGLSEARREGREFGEEGVRAAIAEAIDSPVGTLARSVHAAARVWSGGRVSDDVAIAVVKRIAA